MRLEEALSAFSARAGGAVCGVHAARRAAARRPTASPAIERLLSTPLADAPAAQLSDRARRDALAVSRRRTRSTAASGCGRSRPECARLGDGIELDDSKERIDRSEVHRFLSEDRVLGARPSARDAGPPDRRGGARRRPLRRRPADRLLPRGDRRQRRSSTSQTSTCSRSTAAAGSARSSCARWSRTATYARAALAPAHPGHALALPQVRLRGAELQGDGEARRRGTRARAGSARSAAVRAVEELEVHAVGRRRRRRRPRGGTRSRRGRGGTRRRARSRSRSRACCAASRRARGSRARSTGSQREPALPDLRDRARRSRRRTAGRRCRPRSREYAAAIA